MPVTANEVLSHLCKILTLIIVKTYLQTIRRGYRVAQRLACYNSAKAPETPKPYVNVQKRIRFPLDAQVEMTFIIVR